MCYKLTSKYGWPHGRSAALCVAVLFPNGKVTTRLQDNHALGVVSDYNQPYTYYFGSAWAKYDIRTADEWQSRIQWFLRSVKKPLQWRLR